MKLPRIVPALLDKLQPSESVVVGGAAVRVGLATGASIRLFEVMIHWAHTLSFEWLGDWLAHFGHWLYQDKMAAPNGFS